MKLTELKSSAEAAKASPLELEMWRDGIEPDDVLRLVEVAKLAREITNASTMFTLGELLEDLHIAMEGIES